MSDIPKDDSDYLSAFDFAALNPTVKETIIAEWEAAGFKIPDAWLVPHQGTSVEKSGEYSEKASEPPMVHGTTPITDSEEQESTYDPNLFSNIIPHEKPYYGTIGGHVTNHQMVKILVPSWTCPFKCTECCDHITRDPNA